ncbi:MAG: tagaturonate reductase [Flavobacteriaceae bacterium]|nr:tagaturonate reductase [Flavobacteriaceae bacterium]MDG1942191.1 tagaturonate reductase [Flavobacteriaceae bacterium]
MRTIITDSIQFGEGNFLRAFVDYCIQILNKKNSFSGKVDIIQPLPDGMIEQLKKQKGKYHLYHEGILQGKNIREGQLIDCVDKMINPYHEFDHFLKLAENENLTFVFSNTTEAGISLDDEDQFTATPAQSFPGKLTQLLHHRYKTFKGDLSKVLHIIPCELIDKNGSKLKEIILELCKIWKLDDAFVSWIHHNHFYNTLVDRIVPGFPKKDLEFYKKGLSFDDQLIVTCEPFFLWVIEGNPELLDIFPADRLKNIDVKLVPDLGIYRTRKVRILNGSHTTIVPIGLLHGTPTVSEALQDDFLKHFLSQTLLEEIIPSIDFDRQPLEDYAQSVLERFSNPFIIHQLESISLNSISKFKVRVLPSLQSYYKKEGKVPKNLTFAMAALFYFYGKEISKHPHPLKDDPQNILFFKKVWENNEVEKVVSETLSNTALWDQNLAEIDPLKDCLTQALNAIVSHNKISEAYHVFQSLPS